MSESTSGEDALTEEFEKTFTEEMEALPEEEVVPEAEEGLDLETVKLQQALKSAENKNLMQLAEMENLRKRMQKEKQDMMRFAMENVISEFLGPLDSMENALGFAEQGSDEVKNWAKGFEMILTQFNDVLSEHNVNPYPSIGKAFDPHFHEALEIVEDDDKEEGTIIHEFAKGYKCGDRVLRAARVKVTKKKKEKTDGEEKK